MTEDDRDREGASDREREAGTCALEVLVWRKKRKKGLPNPHLALASSFWGLTYVLACSVGKKWSVTWEFLCSWCCAVVGNLVWSKEFWGYFVCVQWCRAFWHISVWMVEHIFQNWATRNQQSLLHLCSCSGKAPCKQQLLMNPRQLFKSLPGAPCLVSFQFWGKETLVRSLGLRRKF